MQKNLVILSRIGMWVMLGALVLSFFVKGKWITAIWITGAVVCGICLLLLMMQRRR